MPIEDNIKLLCPAISNCVMIGDKRKFCTALVTLKTTDTGNGGHSPPPALRCPPER